MSVLTDRIDNFEKYKEKFSEWEAIEQIIDDKKAFWMLKKPDSQYQKVCLYRDGCNMFVYGDYGQFTFDSMTWLGDVYNLEYDNIGYQMEKLSHDSKEALYVFDDYECKKDIINWLKEMLSYNYNLEDDDIEKILKFSKETKCDWLYLDDFIEENEYDDLTNLLLFIQELFSNIDEYEWISFLRQNYDIISNYDEVSESSLCNAGKIIHQKYFICMYALQVCGEKLKERNK